MSAPGGGFAAAALPVGVQTIRTDDEGLVAGAVNIAVADGEMAAYRARPDTNIEGGKLPTVLVVQEIFGVHEHIRDICRRLAKLGYLAIAPELYARQGDVSGLKEHGEILQVVAKVPDAQVMADLDATAAWAAREGGDVDKLAITGFCWGGRIAWLYAARNLRLKAGIAWYGGLVRPVTPNTPVHPIDIAASLKVPVLGLYGGADSGIPVDSVEKMRAALGTGDSGSEIVLYADTPHGFHADYRPSYRPQQAGDGWTRMIAWLRQHGVA